MKSIEDIKAGIENLQETADRQEESVKKLMFAIIESLQKHADEGNVQGFVLSFECSVAGLYSIEQARVEAQAKADVLRFTIGEE